MERALSLAEIAVTRSQTPFDRAGIVTIGCNIHDRMIGHVYVAATPHLATTGADGRPGGRPPGRPLSRAGLASADGGPEDATSRPVSLERAGSVDLTWRLKLRPALRPRRAPVPGQRGYR